MNTVDTMKLYREVANEFASDYDVTDSHIIDIITSVMVTRDGVGLKGGGFVQSVVNNNLSYAINSANQSCLQNLKVIVAANLYAYVPIFE
jgi:hypothetical protein